MQGRILFVDLSRKETRVEEDFTLFEAKIKPDDC